MSPYDLYLKRMQDEDEEATLDQKLGYTVVDVRAKSDEGHPITIEMQVYPQKSFIERTQYYLYNAYVSNFNSNGTPNPYQNLKTAYGINICDFDILDGWKNFSQSEKFDKINLKFLSEMFDMKSTELILFDLTSDNFPSEEQYARTENLKHWQGFFKGRELSPHAPDYIQRAYEVSQLVNLSKEERELMTQAERDRADTIALINHFREEGLEEGIRRGRKERDEEALYYQAQLNEAEAETAEARAETDEVRDALNQSHEVAYQLYEVGRIDYGDLQAIVQLDDEDLQEQLAIRQSQHDQGLELE